MTAPGSTVWHDARAGTVLAAGRTADPDTGEIVEWAELLIFGPARHDKAGRIICVPEVVTVTIDDQQTGPVRPRHTEARRLANWLGAQKRVPDTKQTAMVRVLVGLTT